MLNVLCCCKRLQDNTTNLEQLKFILVLSKGPIAVSNVDLK